VGNLKDLKPTDYKILFELMKNSHRSDRQISKVIGVSQPTVTRKRDLLEANYLEGYTIIPKFGKIGYELAALTFIKSKAKTLTGAEKIRTLKTMKDWYDKQPNVILVVEGRGLGWDTVCVSLHKNYEDYAAFVRAQDAELSEWIVDSQTFNADLKSGVVIKPFNFKYLASQKQE
jgi:DNA-binding Lrp family transcriptional regulator